MIFFAEQLVSMLENGNELPLLGLMEPGEKVLRHMREGN
jgi:hypothetical protein